MTPEPTTPDDDRRGVGDAHGSVTIAAPAHEVYGLVSDPDMLARISAETARIVHRGGAAGVGNRFIGINRNGMRVWATVSTVLDADPGRLFRFRVDALGIPVSEWTYRLEDSNPIPGAPAACVVTESVRDLRPGWIRPLTRVLTGVKDRGRTNGEHIAATLERLREVAEQTSSHLPTRDRAS